MKRVMGRVATESARMAEAGSAEELPHALTFFLSAGEREEVLGALKRIDRDRGRALVMALKKGKRGGGGK